MKKTLKTVGNVLFYLVVLFILVFAVTSIISKKNNGVAKVFGYSPVVVVSDSMVGDNEDSFNPKDIIYIKTVKDYSALEKGQIISFYDKNPNGTIFVNSHRIVDKKELSDGRIIFQTQGDKYDEPDALWRETTDIIGVYVGQTPKLGAAILWMQSSFGFFVIVVLPSIIFLGFEIVKFCKILLEEKVNSKKSEEADEIQKLKEELEALKKQKNNETIE